VMIDSSHENYVLNNKQLINILLGHMIIRLYVL